VLLFVGSFGTPARADDPTPLRLSVETPPLYLRAEPGLEPALEGIVRIWPEAASAVAAGLRLDGPAPVEIVVLRGETFRRWSHGMIPDWGVGIASWPDGPITLDVTGISRSAKSLDEVLRHELSHVYLGQILGDRRPPTWFVEGVAQAQSGEWRWLDTFSLVQAASSGRLPRLTALARACPRGGRPADLAYRIALRAVLDLDRRLEAQGGWVALVHETARRGRFDEAFQALVGMRLTEYEEELYGRLRGRYGWIAAIAGASTLFSAMTVLFLLGTARAYWHKRRRLREMEHEEDDVPDAPWADDGPRRE
jgi:hypothetical protein